MQVNETNNFKIYLYVCIKFFLYKIFFWQLKLMSIITIFTIKITFKKLSKMLFIVEKNLFCPKDFQTFVLPSSSLFFFLGRYWFYRRNWFIINSKAYGIIMSLNWNSKTQIFECLVKQSSDLDVCSIDRVLYRENFSGKNIFFNWDSLHARLNGHYKSWSYKKRKKNEKIKAYRKSV